MSIDRAEVMSAETSIKTFSTERIEEFLAEHGIRPVIEQPQKPEEEL